MAQKYLSARVEVSKARNASAQMDVQLMRVQKLGVAHEALCDALQIIKQAKMKIWETKKSAHLSSGDCVV